MSAYLRNLLAVTACLLAPAAFAAGVAMITDASGRIEAETDGAPLGERAIKGRAAVEVFGWRPAPSHAD